MPDREMTDVAALCVCGHVWGHHMGTADGSCTSAWGCDCKRFDPLPAPCPPGECAGVCLDPQWCTR